MLATTLDRLSITSCRLAVALGISAVLTGVSSIAHAQEAMKSAHHDYEVVTAVDGVADPWAIAFLPDGEMLISEQGGNLRAVRDGELVPGAVEGVPEVVARGQGGLLDVVPHPDFASNRLIYISYSKPGDTDWGTTAVIRARYDNGALHNIEEIFLAESEGRGHYGCKLAFDSEGYLFITIGDRQAPPRGDLEVHPAQDRSNHHGTINRIHDDGRIPSDNPFVGQDGVRPEIWSFGHRNPQGLAIHPETGDIWSTEHGPQGGDELNHIQPGVNYGWPVVGYGVNYGSGTAIHEGTHREGMEHPAHIWVPSIGTSGLVFYTGDQFPEWKGDLLAGGLVGQQIARLTLDGLEVVGEETIAQGMGRVRDIRQGPDGLIYVAVDTRSGGTSRIYRIQPAQMETRSR